MLVSTVCHVGPLHDHSRLELGAWLSLSDKSVLVRLARFRIWKAVLVWLRNCLTSMATISGSIVMRLPASRRCSKGGLRNWSDLWCLPEVLIALIAVVVAGLIAGCLGGDYWLSRSGLAAFAFLVAFLGGNFLFRKVVSSCLE